MATVYLAALLLVCSVPTGAAGIQQPSIDTSTLETDSPAMRALLEKTIFKVDVAWLDIWFVPDVAQRLRSLGASDLSARHDSIASVAIRATDVLARLTFVRDVSLDQFLDGLQASARQARRANIITGATLQNILASNRQWYAPLEERGIRDGDEMLYRIRGDTLRTIVQSADGTTLLDQRDVGPERRLAGLGGYLAAGSDFRDGLIDSVIDEDGGSPWPRP